MAYLDINGIVTVNVSVSQNTESDTGFNKGLIVGLSTVIDPDERIKEYYSADAMLEDGFESDDPEYLAAVKYFGQNPSPASVYIGGADGEASTEETLLDVVKACYEVNSDWYGLYVCDAINTMKASVAEWAADKKICLFYENGDTAAKSSSTTTDVFSVLKAANRHNAYGLFSTTNYAGAAAMGLAMGLNDGTDNSAFTMAYKSLNGITPEELTNEEVATLKSKNANVYITRAGHYNVMEQGICADGTPFDEVLGLHQIAGEIQTAIMTLLTSTRKIPYTDEGVAQFVNAINNVLTNARTRGFITPGVWNGGRVYNIENGEALTEGYSVQIEPVADQSSARKAGRIAPPIYVCMNLVGAVEYAVINVFVND